MPEVQEVFRMATQKVHPEPGALERQHRGQRRRTAQRKASVYAIVAAIGLAAAVIALRTTTDGAMDRTPAALPEQGTDGVAIVDLEGTIVGAIGADGGEKAESLLRDAGWGLSLSPDGTKVVLSDGTDVYTMNADGTDLARLAEGTTPSWSPDGSLIAFADARGIHVISPDGTGQRTVVRSGGAPTEWPAWSPDGERIAYQITLTFLVRKGIYVVDADGGRPTRLTRGSDAFPSWHPDGTTIVFMRVGQTQDVFTVAADGGGRATPLAATDAGESVGRWSPSGDLLAYVMETDVDKWDVHVLDMRTGEDRVVLEGARPMIAWASDRTLAVDL